MFCRSVSKLCEALVQRFPRLTILQNPDLQPITVALHNLSGSQIKSGIW